ncbi:MAG: helix-turn-helix domain-containing protein [Lachnospiraceae bacterium]|nr:helix-turn-helix domain-containing protein [Lachnospiraceae bacterium]
MTSLFEDLKQGLEEAIDYEKGVGEAAVRTFIIEPVKSYSNAEIRAIRMQAGMTQNVFAAYMGVSKKTVEAWECGRTHPTGPACRLLNHLASEDFDGTEFLIQK